MSIKENFFMKLWDVSNYITGFAIAQSLVFAFIFLKTNGMHEKIAPDNISVKIIIFLSIGCIFYMIGVWWALLRAKKLLNSIDLEEDNIIKCSINQSIIGRWIAIIFFTILDIYVICIIV
jgi:hypothetical protein